MDRKEIIELAKKNGMVDFIPVGSNALWEQIEKFVTIAIKHEREACARLSITIPNPYKDCQISAHGYDMGILEYSRAIRARGSNE